MDDDGSSRGSVRENRDRRNGGGILGIEELGGLVSDDVVGRRGLSSSYSTVGSAEGQRAPKGLRGEIQDGWEAEVGDDRCARSGGCHVAMTDAPGVAVVMGQKAPTEALVHEPDRLLVSSEGQMLSMFF